MAMTDLKGAEKAAEFFGPQPDKEEEREKVEPPVVGSDNNSRSQQAKPPESQAIDAKLEKEDKQEVKENPPVEKKPVPRSDETSDLRVKQTKDSSSCKPKSTPPKKCIST